MELEISWTDKDRKPVLVGWQQLTISRPQFSPKLPDVFSIINRIILLILKFLSPDVEENKKAATSRISDSQLLDIQ